MFRTWMDLLALAGCLLVGLLFLLGIAWLLHIAAPDCSSLTTNERIPAGCVLRPAQ